MMDFRSEIEKLLQQLKNSALMGDSAAEAASNAMRGLQTMLDNAPNPTGFDVYVADAPDFAEWRKVAWMAERPSGFLVTNMDNEFHADEPFVLHYTDAKDSYRVVEQEALTIIRRYRVVPAGTSPEQVTP